MRQLNKPTFSTGVVLLAVVITAIILLYNSPQEASALRVVPDSVEYAIGAWHLVHDGSYYIVLDGRQYPSRYPPWFSALFISPAYLLAGDEIGNAIYPVLISGIAGVILAYLLAFRISGAWGGLVACIILLALPSYRFYSREVMSDIPATAIVMAACLLYSRSKTVVCSRLPIFLLAGLFVAVAAALNRSYRDHLAIRS